MTQTLRKATAVPIAKFADGPGFNRHAAEVVYKAMTAMDEDTALVFGRILVADGLRYDLIAHADEIEAEAGRIVTKRAEVLRKRFSATAVSKARAGQDNTYEIRCLAELSKATKWEEQEHPRGIGGRFVQDHTRITTAAGVEPLSPKSAERLIGAPQVDGIDQGHYQQAYQQIRDMLAPYRNPALRTALHMEVENAAGQSRTEVLDVKNGQPEGLNGALHQGDKIRSAAVSVDPEGRSSAGASYAAVSALTGSGRAGAAAANVASAANIDAITQYNQHAARFKGNEAYSGATRTFNRVSDASSLLQNSLGDVAPKKLQYALAVANHVGQFGPEAQKVIGPSADRMAYRYRGTERELDPKLTLALRRLQGDRQVRSSRDFVEGATGGIEREEGWDPGPVLDYFHKQLPNPDLNELQRKSGVIPPSEGIILTANGRVGAQSSGFADDWYLPFNLKHLSGLQGGQYIRTRTFGGPTTEDIYTGLMSGARSMTVISHNGVYTVDFDKNLRGGRRFNDKATRMVGRYGNLLDAVRNGAVGVGSEISRSRMNELRAKALETIPDENTSAHKDLLRALERDERANPRLSQVERDRAATEWLGLSASRMRTRDGNVMRPDEMAKEILDARARDKYESDKAAAARHGNPPPVSPKEGRERFELEYAALDTQEQKIGYIAQLGGIKRSDDFASHMARTEEANADRMSVLKLNGRGYHTALLALKEQFPYYIADVRYKEWRSATGRGEDATHERKRDTGYVMPRHNRPQEARAGYFDARINGTGKVRADSIRYQNRQAEPTLFREEENEGPSVDASPRVPQGAQAAQAQATAANPQRAANMAMLDELLAQTNFAEGTKLQQQRPDGIWDVDFSGAKISEAIKENGFPSDALKTLYGTPRAELENMPDDAMANLLTNVLRHVEGPEKALAVSPRVAQAFKNKGAVEPLKPLPSSPMARVNELDADHSYPSEGAVYDPDQPPPPPATVKAHYDAHTSIQDLVKREGLPAIDAPDEEFNAAVKTIGDRLIDTATTINRRRGEGGGDQHADTYKLDRDSNALARATQLRRRYRQAVAAHPAPVPEQPQTQVIVTNPADLEAAFRRMNAEHPDDQRRVIQ